MCGSHCKDQKNDKNATQIGRIERMVRTITTKRYEKDIKHEINGTKECKQKENINFFCCLVTLSIVGHKQS